MAHFQRIWRKFFLRSFLTLGACQKEAIGSKRSKKKFWYSNKRVIGDALGKLRITLWHISKKFGENFVFGAFWLRKPFGSGGSNRSKKKVLYFNKRVIGDALGTLKKHCGTFPRSLENFFFFNIFYCDFVHINLIWCLIHVFDFIKLIFCWVHCIQLSLY